MKTNINTQSDFVNRKAKYLMRFKEEVDFQKKDFQNNILLWIKAAEQGEKRSRCLLGCTYYFGHYVRKNYKKAVYWLKQAALQDDDMAQIILGDCFFLGKGVPQNYKTAVYWYTRAAENGNVDSQYIVGLTYYFGEAGVRKNYKKAFKYFTMASDAGHIEARTCLVECYAKARGTKKDVLKASELLRNVGLHAQVELSSLIRQTRSQSANIQ